MKTDPNGNEIYQGYTLVKPAKRGEPYRVIMPSGKEYLNGGTTRDEARVFVKELAKGEKIKAESPKPKPASKHIRAPLPVATKIKTIAIRLHGGVAKATEEKIPKHLADKVTAGKLFVRILEAPRSPRFVGQYGVIDKTDVLTREEVAEYEERRHARRMERKEKKRKRTSAPIRHGRKVA